MFNEGQKLEYIEDNRYTNLHLEVFMPRLFGQTEPIEKRKNKDVAEWTSGEIVEYYKSLCRISLDSLANLHSQFRKYAEWCWFKHLLQDNQNHFEEINRDILQTCLNVGAQNSSILTRKQMENEISILLNARDQCLVYAFFEGIQGKQFSELTELSIAQLDGTTLHLATRTIPVSEKFAELMRESSEEYKYYSYGDSGRELVFDKTDKRVFKSLPNASADTQQKKRQRLYSNLLRVKTHIGNPCINATSLIESGRIDMIRALMKKEGSSDIAQTIKQYEKDIFNKYGNIHNVTAYLLEYGRYYEEG